MNPDYYRLANDHIRLPKNQRFSPPRPEAMQRSSSRRLVIWCDLRPADAQWRGSSRVYPTITCNSYRYAIFAAVL
jgi:hypothetical protein